MWNNNNNNSLIIYYLPAIPYNLAVKAFECPAAIKKLNVVFIVLCD